MDVLVKSLLHPSEFVALLKFKLSGGVAATPYAPEEKSTSFVRCLQLLDLTSRSFAAVIKALDPELRRPICIFYLVLRGLDTVEDDMTISIPAKRPMLLDFYKHLTEPGWTFTESGPNEKDRQLLVEFDVVIAEFLKLKPVYQDTIADICKRMGFGMANFLDKGVTSLEEWDLYCHYVAGLVGIGLSKLFSQSGAEEQRVGADEYLSNSMGLFLQKTNIIRDYLEDVIDGRIFWPSVVWSKYAGQIGDFRRPENLDDALTCLNELVTNALHHVPDVFEYMSRLRTPSVYNFCAIPQVMAIATLAEVYNNPAVFTSCVKMRKGLAVKMMMETTNFPALVKTFRASTRVLAAKITPHTKLGSATAEIVNTIMTDSANRCKDIAQEEACSTSILTPILVLSLTVAYGVKNGV